MIFFNFLDCKKMCFCIFINVKKWDIFQNFYSLCADSISGSSRKVQVDSNTWLGLNFCSTSTRAESSSVKSNGFSNNLEAPVLGGLGRWMSGLRKSSSLKHSKKERKSFFIALFPFPGKRIMVKRIKKNREIAQKWKKKKKNRGILAQYCFLTCWLMLFLMKFDDIWILYVIFMFNILQWIIENAGFDGKFTGSGSAAVVDVNMLVCCSIIFVFISNRYERRQCTCGRLP